MITVNRGRLLSDLHELAQIGRFKTGVDRVALSPADLEARRWLMRRMHDAGLDPHMDEVANVYGRDPDAVRTLLIGSHTDTVPRGGWLDGAMGVIYALEIARAAKESGASSSIGIDVMSFQDEEGTYLAFLGSRTFCNNLTAPEIDAAKSGEVRLRSVLANVDPVADPHRIDPARHLCYLEAHIEQGPRLEQAGRRIGVVTGVVGIRRFRIHTRGQADHAGTTPMSHRKDAGAALIRLAGQVVQEFPRLGSAETVWNIGSIILRPGAPNVVPNAGEMVIEFRDTDPGILDALESHLRHWVDQLGSGAYAAELEPMALIAPTPLAKEVASVLAASSKALGEDPMHIPSGAGHDAMVVGRYIPAAMLFVPSIGGRSHDVTENTSEADIVFGCEVLAHAVDELLASPGLMRPAAS
ncbi:MAG TPA: M20 family metallo-hydrolase [Xanthobacteraceae bacterium]|jgi:N-carbamoyl-L-amino-acid hydrolase